MEITDLHELLKLSLEILRLNEQIELEEKMNLFDDIATMECIFPNKQRTLNFIRNKLIIK